MVYNYRRSIFYNYRSNIVYNYHSNIIHNYCSSTLYKYRSRIFYNYRSNIIYNHYRAISNEKHLTATTTISIIINKLQRDTSSPNNNNLFSHSLLNEHINNWYVNFCHVIFAVHNANYSYHNINNYNNNCLYALNIYLTDLAILSKFYQNVIGQL